MTKNIFISSLVLMVFLFSCSGPVEPTKVEGSKSFYGTEISLEQALSNMATPPQVRSTSPAGADTTIISAVQTALLNRPPVFSSAISFPQKVQKI